MKRLAINLNDRLEVTAMLEEIPSYYTIIGSSDYTSFIIERTRKNQKSLTSNSIVIEYHPDLYSKNDIKGVLFYAPEHTSMYSYSIYNINQESFVLDKQSLFLMGSGLIDSLDIKGALNKLFNISLDTNTNSNTYFTMVSDFLYQYKSSITVHYINFDSIYKKEAFDLIKEDDHKFVSRNVSIPYRDQSRDISEEDLKYFTFLIKNLRISNNEYDIKRGAQQILSNYKVDKKNKNSVLLTWILVQESENYERSNILNYNKDRLIEIFKIFDSVVSGELLEEYSNTQLENIGISEEEILKYTYHYADSIKIKIKEAIDSSNLNDFISITLN